MRHSAWLPPAQLVNTFHAIHGWFPVEPRSLRDELLEGPRKEQKTVIPAFDTGMLEHIQSAVQTDSKFWFSRDQYGDARSLKRPLIHTLYIDYGMASPCTISPDDRHFFEKHAGFNGVNDYRFWENVQCHTALCLGLPLVGMQSTLQLYSHFMDKITHEYKGSLQYFWAAQGLDALAFKLCYDFHVVKRLQLMSEEIPWSNLPFSKDDARLLTGAILRISVRHLPPGHLWRDMVGKWEEWHPEMRSERERQERLVKMELPLVVHPPEPETGCTCM